LANAVAGLGEVPTGFADEEVHAGATTAGTISATALIAEPRASAIDVIEAVAIFAAAEWAWLMFVGELSRGDTGKARKNVRPLAASEVCDFIH